MNREIIEKVVSAINKKSSSLLPKFSSPSYSPHLIELKNFSEIGNDACNSVASVDGGNAEIIGNSSFSLSLIRVAFACYKNTKKTSFGISTLA